ncbi:type II secretion system protein GspM [Acidovorax sp. PRC11]|uniref:type II secretion system protein GspM n=1 Tax=Acidovorax sp. PRC11 TaxID=2962592 RepID=UPI002880DE66|nr:type II secretion system protein GspM [Acidovorax sp. PRC11]MDT0137592.1 type II secretion system protein GspM [Acidovorax sp. PRC11]
MKPLQRTPAPARSTAGAGARTEALRARWKALAPREQSLVLAAAALVALALLWWVLLAPAVRTLREAPQRHAELDAQLQRMQALQAEALQLQAAPAAPPGDPSQALRTALTQRLGPQAQIAVLGDRATVTLKAAPADGLAEWLAQARSNARTVPVEARLARSTAAPAATTPSASPVTGPAISPRSAVARGTPAPAPAADDSMPRWDGTLVLALPAR